MEVKSGKGLFTALVLVALLSLTQFIVLNQRLEKANEDLLTLDNSLNSRIQELQSLVESQEATINTLTTRLTELQETVDRLTESTSPIEPFIYFPVEAYRNDFEGNEIGSIPAGWNRTSGAIHDQVSVQNSTSVSGSQSLWFNETGGDDERIELRTHNISELYNIEVRYSFKISHQRGVIQVANETGKTVFMVNCKVGEMWGYWVKKDLWCLIPNSPIPEPGTWYDVTILVCTGRQLFRVYIDGCDSGWIQPVTGWEHVSYITFRGNNNFPGEFWVDDFKLSKFK